ALPAMSKVLTSSLSGSLEFAVLGIFLVNVITRDLFWSSMIPPPRNLRQFGVKSGLLRRKNESDHKINYGGQLVRHACNGTAATVCSQGPRNLARRKLQPGDLYQQ